VRKKRSAGSPRERRIDGLPGTMVNFGSNRLIPEFEPAPTGPDFLHAFRELARSPLSALWLFNGISWRDDAAFALTPHPPPPRADHILVKPFREAGDVAFTFFFSRRTNVPRGTVIRCTN